MFQILGAQSLPQTTTIIDMLTVAQVVLPVALCVIGALLMAFGYKAYRWIVLLNFVALGWFVGDQFGQKSQIGLVGPIVGAVLLGLMAMPLMKYAVAVCGGLVGFCMGMVVWAYCEQPLDMAWAGGLVGLVVLGMLSFVLFKTTIILFTCVEGAAMFVFGTAAMLIRYTPWSTQVGWSLSHRPVLLPLLVFSMAVVALFWQHQVHGLIGHEGGGGGKAAAGEGKKK